MTDHPPSSPPQVPDVLTMDGGELWKLCADPTSITVTVARIRQRVLDAERSRLVPSAPATPASEPPSGPILPSFYCARGPACEVQCVPCANIDPDATPADREGMVSDAMVTRALEAEAEWYRIPGDVSAPLKMRYVLEAVAALRSPEAREGHGEPV